MLPSFYWSCRLTAFYLSLFWTPAIGIAISAPMWRIPFGLMLLLVTLKVVLSPSTFRYIGWAGALLFLSSIALEVWWFVPATRLYLSPLLPVLVFAAHSQIWVRQRRMFFFNELESRDFRAKSRQCRDFCGKRGSC